MMVEYVCRWCGESAAADNGGVPRDLKVQAHRYCGSALAVLEHGTSLEEVLEQATQFEPHRPVSRP